MSAKSVCFVYWIKRPCDTDIFTQGYIGITKNVKIRFEQHLETANKRLKPHKLYNALKSHDDYEVETIICGTREYCLNLESKLRPKRNIGLNHAVGGHLTISPTFDNDARKKISDGVKRAFATNERYRNSIKNLNKGRKASENTRVKMRLAKLKTDSTKWKNNRIKNLSVWINADKYYDCYIKVLNECSNTRFTFSTKLFLIYSGLSVGQCSSLIKHFKLGWNPNNDPDWLNTFKNKETKL